MLLVKTLSNEAAIVYLALSQNEDMTKSELMDNTGKSRSVINRGIKRLTDLGRVSRYPSGIGNSYKYHALGVKLPDLDNVVSICIEADNTGIDNEKVKAILYAMPELCPLENRTEDAKPPYPVDVKRWLKWSNNSAQELYEFLEPINPRDTQRDESKQTIRGATTIS